MKFEKLTIRNIFFPKINSIKLIKLAKYYNVSTKLGDLKLEIFCKRVATCLQM